MNYGCYVLPQSYLGPGFATLLTLVRTCIEAVGPLRQLKPPPNTGGEASFTGLRVSRVCDAASTLTHASTLMRMNDGEHACERDLLAHASLAMWC